MGSLLPPSILLGTLIRLNYPYISLIKRGNLAVVVPGGGGGGSGRTHNFRAQGLRSWVWGLGSVGLRI